MSPNQIIIIIILLLIRALSMGTRIYSCISICRLFNPDCSLGHQTLDSKNFNSGEIEIIIAWQWFIFLEFSVFGPRDKSVLMMCIVGLTVTVAVVLLSCLLYRHNLQKVNNTNPPAALEYNASVRMFFICCILVVPSWNLSLRVTHICVNLSTIYKYSNSFLEKFANLN